jgi:hypothetical protein
MYYYRNIGMIDREIAEKILKVEELNEYLNNQKNLMLFNAKARYEESYTNRPPNCTRFRLGIDRTAGSKL